MTYVWKAENKQLTGFVQLALEDDSHHGHIIYLSSSHSKTALIPENGKHVNGRINGNHHGNGSQPLDEAYEAAWLSLLDQAVTTTGRNGLHSLVAEVNEISPELPILRRAGFAIYTRQDIWVLNSDGGPKQDTILCARESADDWEIQLLYSNTVPRLVQLVEPIPPLYSGQGWILREENELTAFVHIHDGPAATWMQFFIHPNAEARIDEIVQAALGVAPPRRDHPVYCCVRRYQSWIQNALMRNGFSLWGSQAVMVKHTVHHVQKSLPDLAKSLDGKRQVSPSAPIVQRYKGRNRSRAKRHKRA
ncbi:MAG: hypothetical protein AAF490_08325 [Chloroflexota bacterium]